MLATINPTFIIQKSQGKDCVNSQQKPSINTTYLSQHASNQQTQNHLKKFKKFKRGKICLEMNTFNSKV